MEKIKIMLVLFALVICGTPAFGLLNQSFEVPTTANGYMFPFGWEAVYMGMPGVPPETDPAPQVVYHQNDAANAHSGSCYMETTLTGSGYDVIYPHVGEEEAVTPGQTIDFSLWGKKNPSSTATEFGIKLELYAEAGQGYEKNIGIRNFNVPFTADNTWTEVSQTGWVVPANVYYIRFVIAYAWNVTGTYYWDDFTSSLDNPEAFAPTPADGSIVGYTVTNQVSWANPEPSAPGETVTQTVYFADLTDGDPNVVIGSGVGLSSMSIPALADWHDYHWRVDCYDSGTATTTVGDWWDFSTGDGPPVLDMQWSYVWLDPDPNVVVNLNENGSVIDDARTPMTLAWDLISADSANPRVTWFDPNTIENPTVEFYAPGDFEFGLTAKDGQSEVFGTLHVIVYDTACDAAKGDPADLLQIGDVDEDCDVDIDDLRLIADNWIECMTAELSGMVPSCP